MKKKLYFLTLFRIKGHTRWRASLSWIDDVVEREKANGCEITENVTYVIDRISGEIIKSN